MKKVLLLEDEEKLAQFYTKELEENDYEVVVVTHTDALVEKIKTYTPDIVLLDHGLHDDEKTGLDLLPEVRKTLPNAQIFMLSNYSHFHLEKKVLQAGGQGYFVKTNTPPDLLVLRLNQAFRK